MLAPAASSIRRWIIAKYRWYGFVGDDTRDPPLVSKAMHHVRPFFASASGVYPFPHRSILKIVCILYFQIVRLKCGCSLCRR